VPTRNPGSVDSDIAQMAFDQGSKDLMELVDRPKGDVAGRNTAAPCPPTIR
jgi:hypothetical protein